MPLAQSRRAGLHGFQVKLTAAATEMFGRGGAHDDLVYALACVCQCTEPISRCVILRSYWVP
jgi:hypothetical protein